MIHTQLRAFDAVARHGSFSRAADELGLTQPALTIQVKALEETYGVKLLERNGRSVTLTATGSRLFKLSRRFAGMEEHVRDLLTASHELTSGHLRIAADGPHIVMGLLARVMARHPRLQLSVSMGNTQFVRRQLLEGQVDVAVLPNISGHRRVSAIPLHRHVGVAVVAHDHPWAARTEISIKELDGQSMLGREAGSNTHRALKGALQRAGVRPRFVLELGSREALCEAARAGIGIGIVWELETRGSARFKTLAIRDAEIVSTDYVACLKSERVRQIVKAFFAVAAEFGGAAGLEAPSIGRK